MFLRNPENENSDTTGRNQDGLNRFGATRTSSRNRRNLNSTAGYGKLNARFSRVPTFHILAFIAIFLVTGAIATTAIVGYFQTNTYADCVVAGKDRTTNSEGQSQMRVYTENCGTFTIGDDWFRGNFNTADMYGSLQEGSTYTFQATGFRVGILSMFPNIIDIEQ